MSIDLTALTPATIMLACVFLPVFVAIAAVWMLKRIEARDDRRSPLSEKLLHQSGSQARKSAEELGDNIMSRIAVLFMIGPLCMMAILLPRVRWTHLKFSWADYLVIAIAVGVAGWAIYDIVKLRRERKNWLNGMRGEMATAQLLDRLRSHGCEVFHDVPGERGNIDHIVVAPNAVFAVETKWRSKRGQGAASAEVWFDGKTLEFPNYRDSSAIEQARACAGELGRFLTSRTGEQVRVVAVVALPGWFVKTRQEAGRSEVLAINPKMSGAFTNHAGAPLHPGQRNRIVSAISERYPELDA